MKSNTEGWPLETSIKLRRHLLWSLHPLGYNSFFSPPFLHLPLTSLMKAYAKELPSGKRTSLENTRKAVLILTATLIVLTIIPLYFYPSSGPSFLWRRSTSPPKPPSPSRDNAYDPLKNIRVIKKCDIFRGEWVPNPNAPYYTNETCWAIHEHQNCMKFGRPDTEFMKWRWKPNDCELPIFNPAQFLELVRGKKLAFVGDSVGRNQMQSLMCLLSRVTYAVDISPTPDEYFKRWSYPTHNFTLANFWSPYLVHAGDADPLHYSLSSLFWLHLDEPDKNWTTQVHEFDYVILSAGHWFFRSTMYFEQNRLVGCHYCQDKNVTDLTMYYGYRMAFRTAFQTLINLEGFKGMVFLRTFAPSHFENGIWNKGGDCIRTRPLRSNETRLDGFNLELYMTQLEEFRAAEREGRKKGLKFRLLDTTEAMLLRPDGHPSRYGHKPNANVLLYNDCVHWCLPGPVDAWNDFLLHMLKMEGGRTSLGRLSQSERKMRIRS